MLHYEALRQLTHDRRQQHEREGQAERLALLAHGRRLRRQRRLALAAGLERLLTARPHRTERQAGA